MQPHDHLPCDNNIGERKQRPSRACTARAAARLYEAEAAATAVVLRKQKKVAVKKVQQRKKSPEPEPEPPPSPSQLLPRWSLGSMWELASILNFLNIFRPLLNIQVEFSAEELVTALITPNNTLGAVHMPLLKVAEGDLPIVASHGKKIFGNI